MREDRGAVPGPMVVHEPYTLWGTCGGTVTVVEGGKFYMRGSIYGDLRVEYGGRVHVYGNITGSLTVAKGSKVILSGVVTGDATNDGGRLYVDAAGEVRGRVRTLRGETRIEPKPTAGRGAAGGDGDDDIESSRTDLTGTITPPVGRAGGRGRPADQAAGRQAAGPRLAPPPRGDGHRVRRRHEAVRLHGRRRLGDERQRSAELTRRITT